MDKEELGEGLAMDAGQVVNEPEAYEPEPEENPESRAGPERDEHGRFTAKQKGVDKPETEDTEPPSADQLPRDIYEPLKAVRAENQELKRQIEALQQQYQAQQNPPEAPPSIWEDDARWQQHFGHQVTTEAAQIASMNAKLDLSEMMAAREHPDFADKKQRWLEMAQQNPQLREICLADPDPWGRAYRMVSEQERLQSLGAQSIDDIIKAERAKWEEEARAQVRPSFPTSTARDGSVSGRSGGAWSGPAEDRDILPMG